VRFYNIELRTSLSDTTPYRQYTSSPGGNPDPAALLVELDLPLAPLDQPLGGAYVRVWGPPLTDIGSSSDFNGKYVSVYGGMSAGLPLANPSQAGLLVSGVVQQAFGNWIDTTQTLDLYLRADGGSPAEPKNLVFNWPAGQLLSEAITNTLNTAYPSGYTVQINISPNLVLNNPVEAAYFRTLYEFASYIKGMTAAILGGAYSGVNIALSNTTFRIWDGSTAASPRQIAFTDLIGQPTWIGPLQMQFNAVMRADIQVGDYVLMPTNSVNAAAGIPITTTPQSLSQYRDKSVFQGTFQVDFVRHLGNSRGPTAMSWISTFNCHPSTGGGS
jgi:hypothetical protein